MPDLKVPLAKDQDGFLISPEAAKKENQYLCPGCDDLLILRQGIKKKAHFAHKVTDSCTNETIIHKSAKLKIAQLINDYARTKKNSPIIQRKCPTCRQITEQTLPERITSAEVERKLESGFIADVVINSGDEIVAAVEVKVTHGVTYRKKKEIGLPFIEVEGMAIIDNPLMWRPVLDHFQDIKCRECQKAEVEYKRVLLKISDQSKVPIPLEYYRTSFIECFAEKCKKQILVFDWPDNGNNHVVPRHPRPSTIQYRNSRMAREKYWGNTCPYCKRLQGHLFLHHNPECTLFSLECGNDTQEAFISDMKTLAIYYKDYLCYE